jgi:hypothetical protein
MQFISLHPVARNITGQRFGRLIALGPVKVVKFPSGANHVHWLCQCDCGAQKVISSGKLTNGNTSSCGCLRRECYGRNKGGLKHGRHNTPEYNAWRSMLKRCYLPATRHYENYGGRGIGVCERWRASFEAFLSDMGERPSSAHSLDRHPNNDGDYEPENCRWATSSQQGRNRRTNRVVQAFGREAPLVSFFPEGSTSRAYDRCLQRIKHGWDIERAISDPVKPYG